MPELLEVEAYRRLAFTAVGRVVSRIDAAAGYIRDGISPSVLTAHYQGATLADARRHGKLLLLDFDSGPHRANPGPLGLRFGMTGRLLVDGHAAIDALVYGPAEHRPSYERFAMTFEGEHTLAISDPRRLGSVQWRADPSHLGVDATLADADAVWAVTRVEQPLKARLLDQKHIAGLGNLLIDDILWRAGLAPTRMASSLSRPESDTLAESIAASLAELGARGGSHTGELQPNRHPGGSCPMDGSPLRRAQIGGRTTWWCPRHQR